MAALQTLITARFGLIPATLGPTLTGLTEAQMLKLLPQVASAESVEALQKLLGEFS